MAYIGFDLDETLGSFGDVSIFTFLLDSVPTEVEHPSPELQEKMELALDLFAECLTQRDHIIGILRPGILDIAKRLQELKDKGYVKNIVIYSNNANPTSLRLAAKMIAIGIGRPEEDFFCNLIHWDHPIRLEPYELTLSRNNPAESKWLLMHGSEVRRDRPGYALKSIRTLKRAFETGKCAVDEEIDPTNFFFFDDLKHPNIFKVISKNGEDSKMDQYFHVNKYQRSVDFKQLLECFMTVIQSLALDKDEEYISHVSNILGIERTDEIKDISSMIKKYNEKYPAKRPQFYQYWEDDTDRILKRLDDLFGSSVPLNNKNGEAGYNRWSPENYENVKSMGSNTPISKRTNIVGNNNSIKSILTRNTNENSLVLSNSEVETNNESRGTAIGGKRKKNRKTRKQSHRKKRATRRR